MLYCSPSVCMPVSSSNNLLQYMSEYLSYHKHPKTRRKLYRTPYNRQNMSRPNIHWGTPVKNNCTYRLNMFRHNTALFLSNKERHTRYRSLSASSSENTLNNPYSCRSVFP